MTDLQHGFLLYGVFLFSTTLHEAAHAWAALRGGDRTAYEGGQVSLNPMPHIRRSPIGMVALPVFSVLASGFPIGFASAPYNREWARRYPRRAGWMALAGPGANLALLLTAALLINLGVFAGVLEPPDSLGFSRITQVADGASAWWGPVGTLLGAVFALNLLLCVFNLLPVPPLDGHSAFLTGLPTDMSNRWQDFLACYPGLQWLGIFIAWKVFDAVFYPMFWVAIGGLYPGVTYS